MKIYITAFLLFAVAHSFGQPSLSSFTSTQQSQLKGYVSWIAKSEGKKMVDSAANLIWEQIRLLQQQAKRDSINYVALQLQVNNIDKAYKKALADSMASLLPSAPIIASIDSISIAGKATDAQVAAIKAWMDKNFKF